MAKSHSHPRFEIVLQAVIPYPDDETTEEVPAGEVNVLITEFEQRFNELGASVHAVMTRAPKECDHGNEGTKPRKSPFGAQGGGGTYL